MADEKPHDRPLALLLAGGGFWGELQKLLPRLAPDLDRILIVPDGNHALVDEVEARATLFVRQLIETRASGMNRSPGFWAREVWRQWRFLRAENPLMVIGLGSVDCLPTAIATRLAGIPFVFIETVTRVDDLSATGKLIYRLRLAKRFYVQWPGLGKRYPRALYEGIVHDLGNRGNNPL